MSTTPPIDPTSAAALARHGLDFRLVYTANRAEFARWLQADARGFLGPRMSDETIDSYLPGIADRRTTGVYDATAAEPDMPVATVNSWQTALTVPGRRDVPAWGISSVTVAPTHRRRGIARALLESELRVTAALGIPMAILTVSESTIYSRFGFAPATLTTDLTIDTRRARWTGPTPQGRVHFVAVETLRAQVLPLIEAKRLDTPGEIATWPHLWDRTFGLSSDDKTTKDKLRGIRYDDADGEPRGFALYTIDDNDVNFSEHNVNVVSLVATTDDAYAGLWSHLLELDLVSKLSVHLRSTDEPLRHQVADFRAVHDVDTRDHLWIRIVDVAAALTARDYSAPLDLVIEVTDPLEFAAGTYRLVVEAGDASVTPSDATPDITLAVNELSSIYLGGFSAQTYVRAGRIEEHAPDAAALLDRAFASPVTPHLPVWF